MTLPSITPNNQCDDDSDMFGPPRTSPYHHHRSRVPMISPKLRQREERKRILQLCAHKLERIKDSETNLRRSVCINNTYCRLTDELRREKQSRYLANLPRTENKPESARDNIFNPYNSCSLDQPLVKSQSTSSHQQNENNNNNNSQNQQNSMQKNENSSATVNASSPLACSQQNHNSLTISSSSLHHNGTEETLSSCALNDVGNTNSNYSSSNANNNNNNNNTVNNNNNNNFNSPIRKRCMSSNNIDKDLEILDRELNAINSPMPMIDPEITQGAEQLEKALSSRKRQRSEDESDRLVREALTQFYIPPQRLISAIDDCPLDMVNVGSISPKRPKMSGAPNDLDLEFDMNQNQKDFEVIMDALRLGSPSPTPSVGSDSCGQAAMMSESANVFHNLVVTSLET